MQPNFLPPEIKEYLQNKAVSSAAGSGPFLNMSLPSAITWPKIGLGGNVKDKIFVGIIFATIIFATLFGYQTADAIYRVYSIRSISAAAASDLTSREFTDLDDQIVLAHRHLTKLEGDLRWLARLGFVPVLGNEITAAYDKAGASADLLKVLYPAAKILSSSEGDVKYVMPAQKSEIINLISSHSGELKAISARFNKGDSAWLPDDFKILSAAVADLASISGDLPALLGVEKEARYLILLANNLEIRPGGGFIGSYAVVTVRDGTITDMYVDDSYALYRARDPQYGMSAPVPMQKYLQVPTMHFRDSNWSPDYPTTVQFIKEAYASERGPYASEIDGVITVSTEILKEILGIVGPTTVRGVTFSERNAISKLQHEVDVAVWYKNIPYEDRKDIVGELASALHKEVEDFSLADNEQLIKKIAKLADGKHIVFNFTKPVAQSFVAQKGWDGRLPSYNSDTLMIVDTNFFGGKTEHLIKKSYEYKVREQEGKLAANLRIGYQHAGYPAPLINDYRTYVRVYVPAGSKLILNSGNFEDVTVSSEAGRTVFGGLVNIPIGRKGEVLLTYELPDSIFENNYNLQVQKQIGSFPAELLLDIQFDNINEVITDKLDSDKIYQIN